MAVKPSWTFVGVLSALGAVAGCGGVSLQVGDGDAGHDGGGAGQGGAGQGGAGRGVGGTGHDGGADAATTCLGLDEATCAVTPSCRTQYCQICPGAPTFAGCAKPGAPVACPTIACAQPTCAGLNEVSCKGTSGCTPGYCPNCSGGKTFAGCSGPNEAVACTGYVCPAPAPCANVATLAACDARTDCHSVFVDPGNCGCNAVGCCAHFSRCADGGQAACKGMPACQIATPYCDAPAYVVSYTASCFEGCVRPTECAP